MKSRTHRGTVFPVMHGGPGEDGTFQGALETVGLAYVGNGALASAVAMHKSLAKLICSAAGGPVIEGFAVANGVPLAAEIGAQGIGELVTKPFSAGSGLGVVFCDNLASLQRAIDDAAAISRALRMEVTVGGGTGHVGGSVAFDPIVATTPAGSWYDFEHRYTSGLSEHIFASQASRTDTELPRSACCFGASGRRL